jgi:hypothetical protein
MGDEHYANVRRPSRGESEHPFPSVFIFVLAGQWRNIAAEENIWFIHPSVGIKTLS